MKGAPAPLRCVSACATRVVLCRGRLAQQGRNANHSHIGDFPRFDSVTGAVSEPPPRQYSRGQHTASPHPPTAHTQACIHIALKAQTHRSKSCVSDRSSTRLSETPRAGRCAKIAGSVWANLADVFGELGVDWLFPVQPRRPVSDGVCFLGMDAGGAELAGNDEAVWRARYRVHSGSRRRPREESQEFAPLSALSRLLTSVRSQSR